MSRTRRVVVPGLSHHLILRGNNRRTLFSYPSDYLKFIACVGKALHSSSCHLHAMTLMTNHVHCIATPSSKNDLALFVQAFAQRYAQYRNRKRNGCGKLFMERYRSIPIEDESHHAVAQIYVDINAWRSGKVLDPLDYPWCTFRIHAGQHALSRFPPDLWTPSRWYLTLGSSMQERAARYVQLARQFYLDGARGNPDVRVESMEEPEQEPCSLRLERPDRSRAS